MVELRRRLELYGHLVGARARSQFQYRLSFALDLLGTALITFIDFLAVLVLFSHLPRLAGWSLAEVAFFFGVSSISFALSDLGVGHLDLFPQLVRSGGFDLMLVRPAGTLFQVIASDLALRRIGKAIQGAAVLVFALLHLHIVWTVGRLAVLIATIVSGAIIYASIWIIGATVTFWTVEMRELTNAFTYGGSFLASYPINIFGGWVQRLMAFVVPLGFVSYFPSLYLLDHPDPLGAPAALRFCSPLVALGLALLAGRVWRFGVRNYRSTGS